MGRNLGKGAYVWSAKESRRNRFNGSLDSCTHILRCLFSHHFLCLFPPQSFCEGPALVMRLAPSVQFEMVHQSATEVKQSN